MKSDDVILESTRNIDIQLSMTFTSEPSDSVAGDSVRRCRRHKVVVSIFPFFTYSLFFCFFARFTKELTVSR